MIEHNRRMIANAPRVRCIDQGQTEVKEAAPRGFASSTGARSTLRFFQPFAELTEKGLATLERFTHVEVVGAPDLLAQVGQHLFEHAQEHAPLFGVELDRRVFS